MSIQFALTGDTRRITEYRNQHDTRWYQLRPGQVPSCLAAEMRTVQQRRIQRTTPEGRVTYYWETYP